MSDGARVARTELNLSALTVVPTFRRELAAQLSRTTEPLRELGPVLVVCNSAGAEAEIGDGVRALRPGRNLGFGGSALEASREPRGQTAGILIVNDDATIDLEHVDTMRGHLDRVGRDGIVLFGEHEGPAGPPGAIGVVARVSGLWALRRWLPRRWRGRTLPFFAAYVGWNAWDRLGGFDAHRYPLYFEDSDLIRRAGRLEIPIDVVPLPIDHVGSATGRARIEVTALMAFGAANYLVQHCGVGPRVARVSVRAALAVRALTDAARSRHDHAAAAWRIAMRGLPSDPELPPFR